MSESHEYQVTARKWRPTDFASVEGQEHITQTLKNAIKQDRVHHAYLFSGPRGVGKTTTARILARALNCTNLGENGEPCNECESCLAIASGRSMDVVEIDGASNNSVEDIRGLRDNAKYPPVNGNYKLYIIDEVHMLSTSAFNALLKTLEEPPKHLIFIFATTEPHKVLATILSRCQRFDFRRMQIENIVDRLRFICEREGMNPQQDALTVIARKGDGSMRDAQSIFDQVVAFCGPDFTYDQVNDALNLIDQEFFFRVTKMMREGNPAEAFEVVDYLMKTGYDSGEFLIGLGEHFRNLLSVLSIGSARLIETTPSIRDQYVEEANAIPQGDIIRALHLTLAAQGAIRTASQPRLRLELLLIQLASMDSTVRLDDLMNAIKGMPEGVAPAPITGGSGSGGTQGAVGGEGGSAPESPGNGRANDGGAGGRRPESGTTPETASGSGSESGGASLGNQGGSGEQISSDTDSGPNGMHMQSDAEVGSGMSAAPARTPNGSGGGGLPNGTTSHGEPSHEAGEKSNGNGINDRPKSTRFASGMKNFPTVTPQQRVAVPAGAAAVQEQGAIYGNGSDTALPEKNAVGSDAAVSLTQIHGQWSNFLEFCDDRKSLITALHSVVPGEVLGSVIRVFVENDFQAGLVGQYYEDLVNRLRAFFKNDSLSIECVIGGAPVPLPNDRGSAEPAVAAGSRHPDEDHPFIKGIIELLGAVKL